MSGGLQLIPGVGCHEEVSILINNDTRLLKLKEVIHSVAREEDLILRRLSGSGILRMPELAFTHQVAKGLLTRAQEILGVTSFQWEMNKGIGAGLTDLVVNPGQGEKCIAIEFKMSGDYRNYVSDIRKLQQLDSATYDRVFCALMDVFVADLTTHPRIKAVEENVDVPVQRVGEYFDFFSTLHSFKTQTCCVIGLWFVP